MNPDTPWPAPAKINLFLHVVGRRPDGYHLLQTVFQFLDHGDDIHVQARADGVIRRLNDLPGVPAESDLVVRAARLLQERTGATAGADIEVHKRLPMGGGLGGGSSNAATVLVALNHLWGTGLDVDALAALGLALGADVPVFVRGQAAWAEGVGEHLTPLTLPEPVYLVIHPGCEVPTAAVFQDPELTRDTPVITIQRLSLDACHNDCEPVTRRRFPVVAGALDWLAVHAPARMSGTGACIFAPFTSRAAAEAVGRQVPPAWRWFVAAGRNRSSLLDRLDAATEFWGVAKR
ncbi:MAG: 4-(cytidine 5'-diphospho)-2-C-methyl-D-erythritol kinase [Gammaproteobacteria bacterium]|nr:4-(cytidine 5'-diphospho)-2-C-methyl-D-erythritol kinase [Gammaproteobacteria bacterium]